MPKKSGKVSTKSTGVGANIGIGYVMLPPQKSRERYVAESYSKGTVSIALEDGGFYADVPVSKDILNYLTFPTTFNELGTQLIWVKIESKAFPVIIGAINKNNEITTFSEHEFELKKELDSMVSVKGNAKNGNLAITVDGKNTLLGQLDILVRNNQEGGKVNLRVGDSLNIKAGKKVDVKTNKEFSLEILDKSKQEETTKINYILGEGLKIEDEFGNKIELNEDYLKSQLKGEFIINDGSEPVLLGDSFVTEVQKEDSVVTAIINAILQAPTTPQDGGAGFKASLVAALQQYVSSTAQRADYSAVKSEITKTD